MTQAGAPSIHASTDRPRFVARAFDTVTFRHRVFGIALATFLGGCALLAIGLVLTGTVRWTALHVVVDVGAALALIRAVHVATLRVDITSRAVRVRSLLTTREIPWGDVTEVGTWSDLTERERSPPLLEVLLYFLGVAVLLWLFVELPELHRSLRTAVLMGSSTVGVHTVAATIGRHRSRARSTFWLVTGGRVVPVRILLDTRREHVALRRVLRRCALEHGIAPPW